MEMEDHMGLLSKYKLSEIQIESNFNENESHHAPYVFSAKFWSDPSLVSIISTYSETLNITAYTFFINFRERKRLVFPDCQSCLSKLYNVNLRSYLFMHTK